MEDTVHNRSLRIPFLYTTRNNQLGVLTLYFGNSIPSDIHEKDTVQFEVRVSAAGNTYAKFISAVDRNPVILGECSHHVSSEIAAKQT